MPSGASADLHGCGFGCAALPMATISGRRIFWQALISFSALSCAVSAADGEALGMLRPARAACYRREMDPVAPRMLGRGVGRGRGMG